MINSPLKRRLALPKLGAPLAASSSVTVFGGALNLTGAAAAPSSPKRAAGADSRRSDLVATRSTASAEE